MSLLEQLQTRGGQCLPLLLLAATETANIDGISAAGSTAQSRRQTAAADAELLRYGPATRRPHALPPLPAGVSPALIGHVVLRELGMLQRLKVVDLGCLIAPAVEHLRLPHPAGAGPAHCLGSGRALHPARVEALITLGQRWGEHLHPAQPLLLAECVPGGTSTALAVLLGLGIEADGLVSGSLRHSAHALKSQLARQGLAAAGLAPNLGDADQARAVLAAVGDPMQPLAAALCLAAAHQRVPVVLAGGSQMAAVLALALALAPAPLRPCVAANTLLATTAWVMDEADSQLGLLLERIGARWDVPLQWRASQLRFQSCRSQALRDYERGYVKEGVGAGGLAVLWELLGRSPGALALACDQACDVLLGF